MISYSDMYQIDLANRRIVLVGTFQLDLPFVFVLNEGQFFLQDNLKCTLNDSIPPHAKMSTFYPIFCQTCRSKWLKVDSAYYDLHCAAAKKQRKKKIH